MAIYSDINQYDPQTKPLLIDESAVYQSIYNILTTKLGTRLFLPEFGSELEDILFEPMDELAELALLHAVSTAIYRWDPRVQLDMARSAIVADYDNHKYDVTLVFKMLGVSDVYTQDFEFIGELSK